MVHTRSGLVREALMHFFSGSAPSAAFFEIIKTDFHRRKQNFHRFLLPEAKFSPLFTAKGKIFTIFHRRRQNFHNFFTTGGTILTGWSGAPLGASWAGGPGANASFTSPKNRPWCTHWSIGFPYIPVFRSSGVLLPITQIFCLILNIDECTCYSMSNATPRGREWMR